MHASASFRRASACAARRRVCASSLFNKSMAEEEPESWLGDGGAEKSPRRGLQTGSWEAVGPQGGGSRCRTNQTTAKPMAHGAWPSGAHAPPPLPASGLLTLRQRWNRRLARPPALLVSPEGPVGLLAGCLLGTCRRRRRRGRCQQSCLCHREHISNSPTCRRWLQYGSSSTRGGAGGTQSKHMLPVPPSSTSPSMTGSAGRGGGATCKKSRKRGVGAVAVQSLSAMQGRARHANGDTARTCPGVCCWAPSGAGGRWEPSRSALMRLNSSSCRKKHADRTGQRGPRPRSSSWPPRHHQP